MPRYRNMGVELENSYDWTTNFTFENSFNSPVFAESLKPGRQSPSMKLAVNNFPGKDYHEIKLKGNHAVEAPDLQGNVPMECSEDGDGHYPVITDPDDNLEGEDAGMYSAVKSNKDIVKGEGYAERCLSVSHEESIRSSTGSSVEELLTDERELTECDEESLLLAILNHLWNQKSLTMGDEYKPKALQLAACLLHEAYCKEDRCVEQDHTLVLQFRKHKKLCRSNDCHICAVFEFAHLWHSINCKMQECEVKLCEAYKKEIWDEKRNFLASNKFEVLFSDTTLFEKGSFIRINQDLFWVSETTVGKGAHGSVTGVHLYCPKFGYEAKMALKRSIPKLDNNIIKKRVDNYPAKKEAMIFERLRRHPNIVSPTLILRKEDGSSAILMEQYACSLQQWLCVYRKKHNALMKLGEAIFFFKQIADAVYHLHKHGIVHKDIKANNVVISEDFQRAALVDFDAAVILEGESICTKDIKGTKGFIAPEVERGKEHGSAADIFSLMCLLLEMLVGVVPDDNHESRKFKVDKIRQIDPKLADLIESGLSENPKDRPPASEIVENPVLDQYHQDHLPLELDLTEKSLKTTFLAPSEIMIASDSLKEKLKCLGDDKRAREKLAGLPKNLPLREAPRIYLPQS